jgi:hypothetical protein
MRSTLQDGFRIVGLALGVVQTARWEKGNKVAQSLRDNRGSNRRILRGFVRPRPTRNSAQDRQREL